MNLKRIIKEEMNDSLGWINDIKPALNMDEEWALINDIDPNSVEEAIKIQEYLFQLGYTWSNRRDIINDTMYVIYHFPIRGLQGDLTYWSNREQERNLADRDLESRSTKVRGNSIYYWSQIKPKLNESDELQWIKDIVPNPKNPQKGLIYQFYNYPDSLHNENIKTDNIIITAVVDDRVYFDTVDRYWANHPSDPGSDIMDKKAFSRMVNSGDIKYIGPSRVNESEEDNPFQWIKDINPIPELKIGSCFTDVMDSTLTKWYINRFKQTLGGTPVIEVINDFTATKKLNRERFEEDLYQGRYKPCNKLMESEDPFQWMKDVSDKKHKYGIVLLEKDYQLIYIDANNIDELWKIYHNRYDKGMDPMLYSIDDKILKGFSGIEPKVDIVKNIYESNELDWMDNSNIDVLQVGSILKDNTSEKGPYFIIRKIIGDTAYIEGVEEKKWKNQFYLETLMEMLDRGEIVYVGERLPINILKNLYPSSFN